MVVQAVVAVVPVDVLVGARGVVEGETAKVDVTPVVTGALVVVLTAATPVIPRAEVIAAPPVLTAVMDVLVDVAQAVLVVVWAPVRRGVLGAPEAV